MEKTARRNIMEIYEIFRKIIKHDLALDRTPGWQCMALYGALIDGRAEQSACNDVRVGECCVDSLIDGSGGSLSG